MVSTLFEGFPVERSISTLLSRGIFSGDSLLLLRKSVSQKVFSQFGAIITNLSCLLLRCCVIRGIKFEGEIM